MPATCVVQEDMQMTTTGSGTAARIFRGTPYLSAGKTGTAQVVNRGARAVDPRSLPLLWSAIEALYIGYAPADDPRSRSRSRSRAAASAWIPPRRSRARCSTRGCWANRPRRRRPSRTAMPQPPARLLQRGRQPTRPAARAHGPGASVRGGTAMNVILRVLLDLLLRFLRTLDLPLLAPCSR